MKGCMIKGQRKQDYSGREWSVLRNNSNLDAELTMTLSKEDRTLKESS